MFSWCDRVSPNGVTAALILVSAGLVRPLFPGSGVLPGVLFDLGQTWVAWPGVRWVTGAVCPEVAGLNSEVSPALEWGGSLDC